MSVSLSVRKSSDLKVEQTNLKPFEKVTLTIEF